MTDQPLANDEAARAPTGEILDARPVVVETKPPTEVTATTTPTSETTEAKVTPSETKPPEGETLLTDKKPEDTKPSTVPDAYTFKAPDGVTLDAKLLEQVTPIFKELGLTNDQAQRLVDAQVARELETAKAPKSTYDALRSDWRTATLSDKDISGYSTEGKSGIDAVKVDIGRALATLDPKLAADFKSAMDLTGAGDNPAFVKTFWRLSQSIVEGKPVSGRGPSPLGQKAPGAKPPTPAQAMYPNLPSATG